MFSLKRGVLRTILTEYIYLIVLSLGVCACLFVSSLCVSMDASVCMFYCELVFERVCVLLFKCKNYECVSDLWLILKGQPFQKHFAVCKVRRPPKFEFMEENQKSSLTLSTREVNANFNQS